MAQSNGGYRNPYDRTNPYEQGSVGNKPDNADSTKTSTLPAAPVGVLKPNIEAFQPRNLATPTIYTPTFGGSRRDRWRAEDHIRALQIATRVAGAVEVFEQVLTRTIEANQHRELVEERRTQIPAKIELENLAIGEQVMQRRGAFAAAVEQQQDGQVQRDRFRQLDAEDFEAALHKKRAEKLKAEAEARAQAEYLAHAEEIGRRQAEAAFHKANERAYEHEAEAESQRRRRDQERHKRGQTADPADDMPADLRAPLRVVRTVAQTREWAEREIAKIRLRADAEGRPPTRDEEDRISQIKDAVEEAEGTIRRRGASDL